MSALSDAHLRTNASLGTGHWLLCTALRNDHAEWSSSWSSPTMRTKICGADKSDPIAVRITT